MKEFLRRVKIIQHQTIEIEVLKQDFLKMFRHNIGVDKNEMYDEVAKIFKTPKGNYTGKIDLNEFVLKKRNHFFDFDKNSSIVKGKLTQIGEILRIETEIQGVSNLNFFLYLLIVSGFSFIMYKFSVNYMKKIGDIVSLLLILIFHVTIIFGLPYLIIRKRIKRMKIEMNNNFIIWTKINSLIEE